jgi:mannonate dehydratase
MHSNRIHRREILDALAGAAVFTPAVAQDVARRANGLPALTIKEDVLPPEQIAWYRNIRQVCSTPQAIGEVFTHPFEVIPLITDRLIDFIRCRVAAMGGITPVRKLAVLCETFAVKTAFQEGGENDPVNQLAAYHIDLSSSAFGIQEENRFPPVIHVSGKWPKSQRLSLRQRQSLAWAST